MENYKKKVWHFPPEDLPEREYIDLAAVDEDDMFVIAMYSRLEGFRYRGSYSKKFEAKKWAYFEDLINCDK